MKTKVSKDNTHKESAMEEQEQRCSCWDNNRPDIREWRMEVMATGCGKCKHCGKKMDKYWGTLKA